MTGAPQRPAARPHELERVVMEAVWSLDRATARQVLEHVNAAAERERAYTTVATTLTRLEGKGELLRERQGRTDVYRATRSREQWLRERSGAEVEELLRSYGDAVLAHFAHHLEGLDPDRRAALRRLADGD